MFYGLVPGGLGGGDFEGGRCCLCVCDWRTLLRKNRRSRFRGRENTADVEDNLTICVFFSCSIVCSCVVVVLSTMYLYIQYNIYSIVCIYMYSLTYI